MAFDPQFDSRGRHRANARAYGTTVLFAPELEKSHRWLGRLKFKTPKPPETFLTLCSVAAMNPSGEVTRTSVMRWGLSDHSAAFAFVVFKCMESLRSSDYTLQVKKRKRASDRTVRTTEETFRTEATKLGLKLPDTAAEIGLIMLTAAQPADNPRQSALLFSSYPEAFCFAVLKQTRVRSDYALLVRRLDKPRREKPATEQAYAMGIHDPERTRIALEAKGISISDIDRDSEESRVLSKPDQNLRYRVRSRARRA